MKTDIISPHICDFNCKENIDYHNIRRQKIENEGWRFLRYTIYERFPTLQQVKESVEKIINECAILVKNKEY